MSLESIFTLWSLLAALAQGQECKPALCDALLEEGEHELAETVEQLGDDTREILATFGCFACQTCELDMVDAAPGCEECRGVGYSREIAATEETDSYRVSMV